MATSQGLSSAAGPESNRGLESASAAVTAWPFKLSRAAVTAETIRVFFFERLRFPLVVFLASFAVFLVARVYAQASGKYQLLAWDASWYSQIIDSGYSTDGNTSVFHNVVFLPLYPMVCSAVKHLFSLATPDAMLLVSAVSTMVMLVLTYNLLGAFYSSFVARTTVLLLAFGPFSLFLYNGYSEALFLCLLALFFVLLLRQNYVAAAVVVGLASACRPYAPLLGLVLAFEIGRRYYALNGLALDFKSDLLQKLFIAIPLTFTGLAAYTLWCYYRFDDPLAFAHGYAAWSSHGAQPSGLADAVGLKYVLDGIGHYASTTGLTSPLAIGLLLFASGPILLVCLRKELFPSAMALLILMFLLYHVNVVKDRLEITNLGRHFTLLFPYPLLLAVMVEPGRIRRFLLRAGGGDQHAVTGCDCVHVISLCPALLLLLGFVILNVQYIVLFYRQVYVS